MKSLESPRNLHCTSELDEFFRNPLTNLSVQESPSSWMHNDLRTSITNWIYVLSLSYINDTQKWLLLRTHYIYEMHNLIKSYRKGVSQAFLQLKGPVEKGHK